MHLLKTILEDGTGSVRGTSRNGSKKHTIQYSRFIIKDRNSRSFFVAGPEGGICVGIWGGEFMSKTLRPPSTIPVLQKFMPAEPHPFTPLDGLFLLFSFVFRYRVSLPRADAMVNISLASWNMIRGKHLRCCRATHFPPSRFNTCLLLMFLFPYLRIDKLTVVEIFSFKYRLRSSNGFSGRDLVASWF